MQIRFHPPPIEDFISLRAAAGWGVLSHDLARRALSQGIYSVTLQDGDEIVGFGRVVGDGALYYYLQDIVVASSFRGMGHGRLIVQVLVDKIRKHADPGATIGLMAAHGYEQFYAEFGFVVRPTEQLGPGMSQVLVE